MAWHGGAGFSWWWNQNYGQAALKEASDLRGSREEVTITAQKKDVSKAIATYKDIDFKVKEVKPLRVRMIPDRITNIAGSWNAGVAGAILLVSLFFVGRMMGLAILLSAAFPRGQLDRAHWREVAEENSAVYRKLADEQTVFYVNIGERFFLPDGSHNQEMWRFPPLSGDVNVGTQTQRTWFGGEAGVPGAPLSNPTISQTSCN